MLIIFGIIIFGFCLVGPKFIGRLASVIVGAILGIIFFFFILGKSIGF
jgi:hypothetical protein